MRTTKKGAFSVKVGSGKVGKRVVRFTAPRTKRFKKARTKRVVQVARPSRPDSSPLRLVWATTKVKAGPKARFSASGSVRPAGTKATTYAGWNVSLQRKDTDTWREVATARTRANGSFTVGTRANWLHSLPYRVRVTNPANGSTLASEDRNLTARPGWSPGGSSTTWNLLYANTTAGPLRLRWNPCGPVIRYRVNLKHAKTGQKLKDVKRAVAETALATGLRFQYRGKTKAHAFAGPNQKPARPADADLLISWTKNKQSRGVPFGKQSSTVGYGGLSTTGAPLSSDARGDVIPANRGDVAMRANWNWGGNKQATYGVLLHELGHAVGLDHVTDNTQVMFGSWMPWTPKRWAAGDLGGLNRMGMADGCIQIPNGRTGVRSFSAPGDDHAGHDHEHVVQVARP